MKLPVIRTATLAVLGLALVLVSLPFGRGTVSAWRVFGMCVGVYLVLGGVRSAPPFRPFRADHREADIFHGLFAVAVAIIFFLWGHTVGGGAINERLPQADPQSGPWAGSEGDSDGSAWLDDTFRDVHPTRSPLSAVPPSPRFSRKIADQSDRGSPPAFVHSAPWQFTDEDRSRLVDYLSDGPKGTVKVYSLEGDEHGERFRDELVAILREGGWESELDTLRYKPAAPIGLLAITGDQSPEAIALLDALQATGLDPLPLFGFGQPLQIIVGVHRTMSHQP